ncbi:MAG: tRNA 4-thiouridine(8) synthase ThiI [Lachnospiraceae bacterium]|nr:tRNA 4-thiouridine(8) synthase ThiI [Lachnospiraceae bacterium]
MLHSFLIKYAEIGVKGKNRYIFEDALIQQIKYGLRRLDGHYGVTKVSGRVYVECPEDFDYDGTVDALSHVFGITAFCPMERIADRSIESIKKSAVEYIRNNYDKTDFSFKVDTKRADKGYPLNSMEADAIVGEAILEAFPETRVDVHEPEEVIHIEIREMINIYSKVIRGAGGMPIGTNGKAMLLLSGGIDSPVAGYMTAKRGVVIDAVYFHAPPYTSERAKQKVVELAELVSRYAGPVYLHVINFTDIQLYIYEKCPHDELTIIMRRYMMKIAERIANENDCLALVTGESIGQVASQTLKSLYVTDEAVKTMPVFRPLIGLDKQEIIDISEKIGTYETSIQPYEDCCTIFVAKHPVTKPNLKVIKHSEESLSEKIDEMLEEALQNDELIIVGKRSSGEEDK